jgi:hypothetical protein
VPSLHRVSIGPLREEAMTHLLRARTGGDLMRPILLRLHRISEGNPFVALEIARALTGQGVRPTPGEPLPVPEDLQALLGIRLAALPSSAAWRTWSWTPRSGPGTSPSRPAVHTARWHERWRRQAGTRARGEPRTPPPSSWSWPGS